MRHLVRLFAASLLLAVLATSTGCHGFIQKNSGSPAQFGTSIDLPFGGGGRK